MAEHSGKKIYIKYTDQQTDLYISPIAAKCDVKSACVFTGITLSSGYKYRNTYKERTYS